MCVSIARLLRPDAGRGCVCLFHCRPPGPQHTHTQEGLGEWMNRGDAVPDLRNSRIKRQLKHTFWKQPNIQTLCLKYSEEIWKFPYLHQKASVSWRTWAIGNSNPQLLPQILENMGSRPRDDEKFCAPYMKPGKSLRNNHIQNKIKTGHVCDHALWFRMFPLFSQNSNNRKAVCPQWILPSIREPLIGNVEFIDVINTVKFSSDYIRRPGNWSPLVSKWSGEQTLKKRKMTTWMSQVNWTIFNRRTDKGSGGEGMEQRPLTRIGVILGFPEKALVFLF